MPQRTRAASAKTTEVCGHCSPAGEKQGPGFPGETISVDQAQVPPAPPAQGPECGWYMPRVPWTPTRRHLGFLFEASRAVTALG